MTKHYQKTKPNPIWAFFSSVKLTIVLLILLAIASVIGTLIPQISQREGVEFAKNLSPQMLRFFNTLDLFDMYHASWFRFIIGCLAMNLIICSVNRFSSIWKLFRTMPRPDRSKPFEHLPPEQAFVVQGKFEEVSEQISHFLKKRYRKTSAKGAPDTYYVYAERGRYSRFGVYIIHSSVLLILIGALFGSFFGFEAFVNIMEGQQTDTVRLRKERKQLRLGFEVRCDKFAVDFYENGTPKEYRSDLSFIIDGVEVEKRSLFVNHPVQFKGVTFYQSTYGTIPGKKVRLKITRDAKKNDTYFLEVDLGNPNPLPGDEGRFTIADVSGNFMDAGPAILVAIEPQDGEEKYFWVFQDREMMRKRLPKPMLRSPKFDPSAFKPYTFSLNGLETGYYTGLQVNRDPGVAIVWTGCFLIIAGFIIAFFTFHLRIWVRLLNKGEGIILSIAGTSSRNPVGLERELNHLILELKKIFQ